MTSFAASSRHSSTVRTLWPSSSPTSQSRPTNCSTWATPRRIHRVREQAQDVDVRVRIELAAAVAADRHERQVARQAGFAPKLAQACVDELAVTPQEARRIRVRLILGAERGALAREALPQSGRVVRRLEASRRDRGHARGSYAASSDCGIGGAPDETVSTS